MTDEQLVNDLANCVVITLSVAPGPTLTGIRLLGNQNTFHYDGTTVAPGRYTCSMTYQAFGKTTTITQDVRLVNSQYYFATTPLPSITILLG